MDQNYNESTALRCCQDFTCKKNDYKCVADYENGLCEICFKLLFFINFFYILDKDGFIKLKHLYRKYANHATNLIPNIFFIYKNVESKHSIIYLQQVNFSDKIEYIKKVKLFRRSLFETLIYTCNQIIDLNNRDDVPYNISDFNKEIDTKNNWNHIENSVAILKLRNLLNNISYSLYHRKDNYDQFFDMQLQEIKCNFQSKNNINSVIENFVFIVDDINNPELNIRVVKNVFFSWMKSYINEYTNGVNFRTFIILQI